MALCPRHRRSTATATAIVLAATLLTIAVAATAIGATNGKPPHLQGRFPVTATITASNFKGVRNGTHSADVYTFTSHCKIGTCKTVTLVRQGGTANRHYRSTLRRTASNIYVGTEGPYPYPCPGRPGGSKSKFTAKHTIRITAAYRTGRVAAFDGSSKYTITGCPVGRFVNYRLRAQRR